MKNGKHLILDIYNCSKTKLGDIQLINDVIIHSTKLIEMNPLSEVFLYEVGEPLVCENDKGITGGIIFIESHMTLHTFPEKNYVSIDIYSCKDFDHEKVMFYLKQIFEGGLASPIVLSRGVFLP